MRINSEYWDRPKYAVLLLEIYCNVQRHRVCTLFRQSLRHAFSLPGGVKTLKKICCVTMQSAVLTEPWNNLLIHEIETCEQAGAWKNTLLTCSHGRGNVYKYHHGDIVTCTVAFTLNPRAQRSIYKYRVSVKVIFAVKV